MNQGTILGADAINRLIQELNKLPGIGPKSAQRLAYYLMRAPQEQATSTGRCHPVDQTKD